MSTYEVVLTVTDNEPGRARSKARKQLLDTLTPDLIVVALTRSGFDLVSRRVAEIVPD